jgi:hypothetical protein
MKASSVRNDQTEASIVVKPDRIQPSNWSPVVIGPELFMLNSNYSHLDYS